MVSMTLLAYEEDKRNRSVVRTLKCPILIEKCIIHLFKFDMKKILFPMPCLPFAYFFLHFSIICTSILLTFLKRNSDTYIYTPYILCPYMNRPITCFSYVLMISLDCQNKMADKSINPPFCSDDFIISYEIIRSQKSR